MLTRTVICALAASCMLSTLEGRSVQAQVRESGALDRGQTLTRWLLEANVDSLLGTMSPGFTAAIGGREGLARLAASLREQAGSERAVLEEAAFLEAGRTTYYRVSRFETLASVTLRWVWNGDGVVVASTVTPTPVPAPSEYLGYETKARLRLPFGPARSGTWYVGWGGRDAIQNYHVTASDQRYAYDFVVVRGNNDVHAGDGSRNEDHFCWGEPVYAPAAGRVVVAVDSIPDNVRPGERNTMVPPGNHIVIDHGDGEYSLLAHFKRGTVAVRVEDAVTKGALIGECGNSGNSTLPHLHYHLQTGNAYKVGSGLPAFFNDYFLGGQFIQRGEPSRGQMIIPSGGR